MLKSKNYYFIIMIKNILNIAKLNFLIFNQYFYKRIGNINIYFGIFIIKCNLLKDLIKKKLC